MAVAFGVLAYVFYEVSVLIATAAIGFVLGTSLMVALAVTWSWRIIYVGLALARYAWMAMVDDLPLVVLAVLTAPGQGKCRCHRCDAPIRCVSLEDFDSVVTTSALGEDWWW